MPDPALQCREELLGKFDVIVLANTRGVHCGVQACTNTQHFVPLEDREAVAKPSLLTCAIGPRKHEKPRAVSLSPISSLRAYAERVVWTGLLRGSGLGE